MAFKLSDLWSSQSAGPGSQATVSLDELGMNYDVIEVNTDDPKNPFVLATETKKLSEMQEMGTSSPSPWTSMHRQEYNPALAGLSGLEKYDTMRRSDGTVRGTLRAIKTPVLGGRWFMQPGSDSDRDKEIAAFIWRNLTEEMSISWTQVLTESLLMMDFGNYMWEKVWDFRIIDGVPRTILTKLAPRHPMDVESWLTDKNGGPVAVRMYCETSARYPDGLCTIPIEKLLSFVFDREAGDMTGISVLRSAYKHWYYKEQLYKIDAIQKERHGIGIPVVKLPLGYKDVDKVAAENLGRNVRTNERAHIVLPPGWDILMLKLEGTPMDCLKSVEHHNAAIRENILVNFIGDSARNEDLTMFFKAARFVADIVSETFSTYLIKEMVDKNFLDVEHYPKLKVRRIGESADWRTLSFALRNLIGAGVIIPDDVLEANMRAEMDLPIADRDTARLVATPQNPFDIVEDIADEDGIDDDVDDRIGENEGEDTRNTNNPNYNRNRLRRRKGSGAKPLIPGMPRQTTLNRTQNSFGVPRRNGGRDSSGG